MNIARTHDAFEVGEQWAAERLLIMTPYFSEHFCEGLVKFLKPGKILAQLALATQN